MNVMLDPLEPREFTLLLESAKLAVQFVLGGLILSFLTYQYQKRTWRHQKAIDIAEKRLDRAHQTLKLVSKMLDKRLYCTNGLASALIEKSSEQAKRWAAKYDDSKDEWNENINYVLASLQIDFSTDDRDLLDNDIGSRLNAIGRQLKLQPIDLPDIDACKDLNHSLTDLRGVIYDFNVKMLGKLAEREAAQTQKVH